MAVTRLLNDELWGHSLIKLSAEIQSQLQRLGSINYLIAPHHLHCLFLAEWQLTYPQAISYGANEVIRKR